ncbi:ATP-binding cassette domain-containing protein [soil metagenome]
MCAGLRYRFGRQVAVDGIDLEVGAGEIFGLLGPNGAGKTTAIRVMTTLLPVQEGTASVFGFDVSRQKMAVRRTLGYVPQQLSAEAALTGRENVALFARLFDVPRRGRAERVAETLTTMGLDDAADRLVSTYSGGMIRRLELAQALVNRPRLLVLDEPTVGLDPVARESVWDRVHHLRRTIGTTVLVTTHHMDEAEQVCDRVGLMSRGRMRAIGTPATLRTDLGPEATLEEVFRHHTGDTLATTEPGGLRDVVRSRRNAQRLG